LTEALKAETVLIAEGEKDADNLRELGFTATTNPLGAGKWRDEYAETLRGKDAVIFYDRDEEENGRHKGRDHAEQVIQSLRGKAKSIKLIELPDGVHDVSDYIESFSSPDEATRAIAKLIEQAQEQERANLPVERERIAKV